MTALAKEPTMKTLRVVTATNIRWTDTRSWRFMFESNMPRDWIGNGELWGFLELKQKDDNHFDPWEWAKMQRGEPHGRIVGDDGVLRFNLNIFQSGNGLVLAMGWDDDSDITGCRDSVRQMIGLETEAVILCMERPVFEKFETACRAEGLTVHPHHYDGSLSSN